MDFIDCTAGLSEHHGYSVCGTHMGTIGRWQEFGLGRYSDGSRDVAIDWPYNLRHSRYVVLYALIS